MDDDEFSGTGRFAIRRRLGGGAYGVVYEAYDREREATIALKTLRPGNRDSLYRLKREFRALADISHRNLVTLHELLADGDRWFITMELVQGVHFLQYVRAQPAAAFVSALQPSTKSETSMEASRPEPPRGLGSPRLFDDGRLRESLRQAASGILALHEAGRLHRDIKPSNVLVTGQGRVVLLDFGLVTDFEPFGAERSLSLVGTPTYMAPEAASREPISEASDWYSLGVMLYESLTGRPPFGGSFTEMAWAKSRGDPPSARSIRDDVPEDLDVLSADLLRRDGKARPTGGDILRRLGVELAPSAQTSERSLSLRPAPFIGRQTELTALCDAFERSRRGHAVRVYVSGTSGIGKSALVRRFLEDARADGAVVLAGRCYERESTPYKALDSLIDSLSQYLKHLPVEQAESLLPADILALTRVFPVLRRVEAVAATPRKVVEIADSFELRRRAFAALRELFVRLAGRRDVVLFIDDLQWGDVDSAALLEELLRPPDPPALLVIVCYRSEEAATSPLLKRLLTQSEAADARHLALEELGPEEARELVGALLESNPAALAMETDAIARESAGNPFFIDELIRFGRLGAETTVEAMVRERVRLLPEPARRLLEVVAVAAQPLNADIAEEASASGGETGALAVLRTGRLVRVRAADGGQEIETYHDRIREAVVAQIPSNLLKEHHRKLASALEASGRADPEQLSLHFQEAGDSPRAAELAIAAAERAAQALAFDRAARFFRIAIELGPPKGTEAWRSLQAKLGDALANAGRGADAARAYLAAAEGASRATALELERLAAGAFLRCGHIDEALPLFERVTGRVGLSLVQPSWQTILQILVERLWIRLRGFRFHERDASQIPAEDLIRLDTYWTLASVLTVINTIRGAEFQNRHLLLALKLGEPHRVAHAIAMESAYGAVPGWRRKKRTDKVVALAAALADRVNTPYAAGFARQCALATAYLEGRWKACWNLAETADAIFRERCTNVTWELDFTHNTSMRALYYMGELRELALRLPGLIREAREHDDFLAVSSLQARNRYVTYLASDQADQAQDDLRRTLDAWWSRKSFTNLHFWAMISGGDSAIFAGELQTAWEIVANRWAPLKRSGLLRLQIYRIEVLHLRARSAIACAAIGRIGDLDRDALLKAATRDIRALEREGAPWAAALARLSRAGISPPDRAPALLSAAESDLRKLDMVLHANTARRRRGQLIGGDEGAALVAEADAWMASQDIKNPARMADMLAPGSWS
jgi:serine/threonine protein kinase